MNPPLIRGLTRAGVGNAGSLKEFVTLASLHGFASVDSAAAEIQAWIGEAGLAQVRTHLETHRVGIGCLGLAVDWSHGEAQFQAGLATLVKDAETAVAVGCHRFMTWAMPSTPEPVVRYTAVTTRRLRLVARILGGYNLKLGIEYIGPVHMRSREKYPFLWDLPTALEWLDAIGEANAGVVLDTFHWYCSEGTLDEIRALTPERIVHVHLNDAAAGPVFGLIDNDRLFPGEGVIPVAGFLKALVDCGYRGIVAQEVLTPQPLTDSPETLTARAERNYTRLFSDAGIGSAG